jgi:integrase
MRRGEICGLKWCDVDLESGKIHVQRTIQQINVTLCEMPTKTKHSSRSIALSNEMVRVLKSHKKAGPGEAYPWACIRR